MSVPQIEFKCFTCDEAKQKLRIVYFNSNESLDQNINQVKSRFPSWIPEECFVLPGVENFRDASQNENKSFLLPSSPETNCFNDYLCSLYPITDQALGFVCNRDSFFIQSRGYSKCLMAKEQDEDDQHINIFPIIHKYSVATDQGRQTRFKLFLIVRNDTPMFTKLCTFHTPSGRTNFNGRYKRELFDNPNLIDLTDCNVLYLGYSSGEPWLRDHLRWNNLRLFTSQDIINPPDMPIVGKRKRVTCRKTPMIRKSIGLIQYDSLDEQSLTRMVEMRDAEKVATMIRRYKQYHFLIRIRDTFHEIYDDGNEDFEDRMQKLLYDCVRRLGPKDY